MNHFTVHSFACILAAAVPFLGGCATSPRVPGAHQPGAAPAQAASTAAAQGEAPQAPAAALPPVTGPLRWEAASDFASGYFSVVYDKGLFFAMPSPFANGLEKLRVADPGVLAHCNRLRPKEMDDLVYVRRGESQVLYKRGAAIGRLSEVSVDGVSGWRYPTLGEMQGSTWARAWQRSLCWKSSIARSDFPYYTSASVFTVTPGSGEYGSHQGVYKNSGGKRNGVWLTDRVGGDEHLAMLVRAPSDIEKQVFATPRPYAEKIRLYARLLAQRELVPVQKPIAAPTLASLPAQPQVAKDEFETSARFAQRQKAAQAQWERETQRVEAQNRERVQRHDAALNGAQAQWQQQKERYASEEYRAQVHRAAMEKALSQVLGKPHFKDMRYDADAGAMTATVFSRTSEFSHPVRFKVPLDKARTFKDDLEKGDLVPLITLDADFNVVEFQAVTNRSKEELEFKIASDKNTIDSYEDFVRRHPASAKVKTAQARIQSIVAARHQEELARQRRAAEAEKRQAAERQAERQAYMAAKAVGDLVCKPGKLALGLVNVTIKAYVERVDGNRVQLRISDTQGQTVHYNGVQMRLGALIWDPHYEWKRCG